MSGGMVDEDSRPADASGGEIGWLRAVVSGLAVVLAGFGGAWGANRVVTRALALRRTPREVIATALFLLVVVLLAWALRRLQDKGLI
jgi:hypothetical protein